MTTTRPGAPRDRASSPNADAGTLRRSRLGPRFRYHRVFGARPPSEWPDAAVYGMRPITALQDMPGSKEASPREEDWGEE
ncbi:MAG: hypothetical protein P8099_03855 [Gemmatimonadota bacterium]|jgi:hypothetical protein